MQDEPDPPRKIYQLGKAEFKRVNPPPDAPGTAAPDEDVPAILRENLARAHAAGLNELTPQNRRGSRRKRDYWALFVAGNTVLGGTLAVFGLRSIAGVFAFSGIILFSAGLTWVMWIVVEDY